ncbi:MAG: SGNH/GDSL hydrolase family protein [Cyanothece sp. SIO1E1]|nr:SGNH/GDSL hydrolase family protein [Cyanothece sp. SIO1E1]
MKKSILATGVVCLSCFVPLQATAQNLSDLFSELYIFGDSLVDTGNLFNLTEQIFGVGAPPSPPYEQLFSNGPISMDFIAAELGLMPTLITDIQLAGAIPTDGVNFAFGGATTTDFNVGGPGLPGLTQQLGLFQDVVTIQPPAPDALYILLAGANDYNEVFFSGLPAPVAEPADLPEFVTANLSAAVESLFNAGGRNFLVINLPNLGETPLANSLDLLEPGASDLLNDLTAEHNLLLDQELDALSMLPDISLTRFDFNALFSDVLADPAQFGFTDVENSCLINFMPGFVFEGVCDTPDTFLFFDNIHPTTVANEQIGNAALASLSATTADVLEPTSVLGLLGLGILGVRAMKRKPQNSGDVAMLHIYISRG